MSRSYKKTPWIGDSKGKSKKRIANSKVRMELKNLNCRLKNNDYKKVYESWDICDFGWVKTWKEYWNWSVRFAKKYNEPLPNKKEKYHEWYKTYKMK